MSIVLARQFQLCPNIQNLCQILENMWRTHVGKDKIRVLFHFISLSSLLYLLSCNESNTPEYMFSQFRSKRYMVSMLTSQRCTKRACPTKKRRENFLDHHPIRFAILSLLIIYFLGFLLNKFYGYTTHMRERERQHSSILLLSLSLFITYFLGFLLNEFCGYILHMRKRKRDDNILPYLL